MSMTLADLQSRSPSPINSLTCANVTPSDTPLTKIALQLLVRVAGNLVITTAEGDDVTIVLGAADVPYTHPSAVKTIKAASTCGGIIAYQ